MKISGLFFSVLVSLPMITIQAQDQACKALHSIQNESHAPDFDKMLNFDELEDEMVKMNIIDSIKPIPPHALIVWVRIIGLPMANAYFAVRRIVRTSLSSIAALLKIKTAQKHEEFI